MAGVFEISGRSTFDEHFFNGLLVQTLMQYVALYNHQLPQSALKSRAAMQAMKDWSGDRPDLFIKRP